MKYLIGVSLCIMASNKLYAQDQKNDSLKCFIVLYTTGEAWDTTKQFYDQAYFDEHSKFLSDLRQKKIITMGARYSDTGMIVLKARDMKAAKKLMDGDISVKHNLFRYELYEMDVFYKGCIE